MVEKQFTYLFPGLFSEVLSCRLESDRVQVQDFEDRPDGGERVGSGGGPSPLHPQRDERALVHNRVRQPTQEPCWVGADGECLRYLGIRPLPGRLLHSVDNKTEESGHYRVPLRVQDRGYSLHLYSM